MTITMNPKNRSVIFLVFPLKFALFHKLSFIGFFLPLTKMVLNQFESILIDLKPIKTDQPCAHYK